MLMGPYGSMRLFCVQKPPTDSAVAEAKLVVNQTGGGGQLYNADDNINDTQQINIYNGQKVKT